MPRSGGEPAEGGTPGEGIPLVSVRSSTSSTDGVVKVEMGVGDESVATKPKHDTSRGSTYASTKTVAQGFLNISLLAANAGQLKSVIVQGTSAEFYYVMIILIISSMVLQVVAGVILALKYFVNFEDDEIDEEEKKSAVRYNNIATLVVMIITAINILISVFNG